MASAELSRRVEKVVAYPPLCEMSDRQRGEFHEALLDADDFDDLPGNWQAAILEAEQNHLKAAGYQRRLSSSAKPSWLWFARRQLRPSISPLMATSCATGRKRANASAWSSGGERRQRGRFWQSAWGWARLILST